MIYYVTAARDEIYFTTSQPEKADWMTRESWSTKGDLAEMRAAFCDFHSDVQAVLAAAPEVHKWGIYERDPLPAWSKGRVVAARRRLPSDDALHGVGRRDGAGRRGRAGALPRRRGLRELSKRHSRTYEAARKPRASVVQAGSSANTWMRRETNPDWLYGYDAWRVPLRSDACAAIDAPTYWEA